MGIEFMSSESPSGGRGIFESSKDANGHEIASRFPAPKDTSHLNRQNGCE